MRVTDDLFSLLLDVPTRLYSFHSKHTGIHGAHECKNKDIQG